MEVVSFSLACFGKEYIGISALFLVYALAKNPSMTSEMAKENMMLAVFTQLSDLEVGRRGHRSLWRQESRNHIHF